MAVNGGQLAANRPDPDWCVLMDFAGRLAELMDERDLGVRALARHVSCHPSHISHLLHGRKRLSPRMAQRLDDIFCADGELVRLERLATLWIQLPKDIEEDVNRRTFIAAFLGALGISAPIRALTTARFVGSDHVGLVSAVVAELERADSLTGGDAVCEGAAALLNTVRGWVYSGSYSPAIGSALTEAAGELGAWVGWTAYDADRLDMARHYLHETFLLARVSDDQPLEARVLSYMCLQAIREGRPREAVRLAETALRVSSGWAPPRMTALLRLRAANGRAGDGDAAGFRRDLALAKNAFERGSGGDDPLWIRFLTAAELAGIQGMSLIELGQPESAAASFSAAAGELADPERPRNACYYQVRLAEAHLQAGDRSAASVAASAAVRPVSAIGSSRTRNRLAALRASLPGSEFANRYDEALA